MKLRIQTLTGETQEVEAEPQNSILDLKVMRVNTTVNMRESRLVYLNKDKTELVADPGFGAKLITVCNVVAER